MSTLQKILSRARSRPATIALSEGTDPRIVDAGLRAARDGLARIILVGDAGAVRERIDGDLPGDVEIADPAGSDLRDALAGALHAARAHKGMTPAAAAQAIADPLVFAAMLVRSGHADGTVGGATHTTADVVRQAIQLIGKAPSARLVSSLFLMQMDAAHHLRRETVVFADCGLVVDPSPEELAGIATDSADSFAALVGGTPRVAMLSFSTHGSAGHPLVDKVRAATTLARAARSDLAIDGELQFDAAYMPDIARSKAPASPVAGQANVFVFPNLDTGNTAYKIAQRIGGATAVGPILQGLARPANDLSRGCTADDAYHLIAVTVVQAGM